MFQLHGLFKGLLTYSYIGMVEMGSIDRHIYFHPDLFGTTKTIQNPSPPLSLKGAPPSRIVRVLLRWLGGSGRMARSQGPLSCTPPWRFWVRFLSARKEQHRTSHSWKTLSIVGRSISVEVSRVLILFQSPEMGRVACPCGLPPVPHDAAEVSTHQTL